MHGVQHVALRVPRGLQESGGAVSPAAPGSPAPSGLLVCSRPPSSPAEDSGGAERESAAPRRPQRSVSITERHKPNLLLYSLVESLKTGLMKAKNAVLADRVTAHFSEMFVISL